jgi:hypothetical protein
MCRGQRDSQQIIAAGLTEEYLRFRALEVQDNLADSPNAKLFFIPTWETKIPVIVDAD